MMPSPQTLPTTAPAMAPPETWAEAVTSAAGVDAEAVEDARAAEGVDSGVEVADAVAPELSGVHMSML
jgi:hypothetical protein